MNADERTKRYRYLLNLVLASPATRYIEELRADHESLASEHAALLEVERRGLVCGYHPGFHHAEGDPRREYWVPQEGGWWCREVNDDGMNTQMYPTLREALAALPDTLKSQLSEEA